MHSAFVVLEMSSTYEATWWLLMDFWQKDNAIAHGFLGHGRNRKGPAGKLFGVVDIQIFVKKVDEIQSKIPTEIQTEIFCRNSLDQFLECRKTVVFVAAEQTLLATRADDGDSF
jgi:hypothetical protein